MNCSWDHAKLCKIPLESKFGYYDFLDYSVYAVQNRAKDSQDILTLTTDSNTNLLPPKWVSGPDPLHTVWQKVTETLKGLVLWTGFLHFNLKKSNHS